MKPEIAVLLFLATFATSALADHHLVKRALQEARCLPASLTELSKNGGNLVYEARCTGAAERVLTLVCTSVRCLADEHASHNADEEDAS